MINNRYKKQKINIKSNKIYKLNPVYMRIYPYLKKHLKFVIFGIILSSIVSLTSGSFPWVLKKTIDHLFSRNNIDQLIPALFILTLVMLIFSILTFSREYFMANISLNISIDLRDQFLKGIIKKKRNFFEEKRIGELISMINHDLGYVENIPDLLIRIFIEFPLRIIILFISMFYLNANFSLIVMVIAPLSYILIQKSRKFRRKLSSSKMKAIAKIFADFQEILSGITIVKLWNIDKYCRSQIANDHKELKKQTLNELKFNSLIKGLLSILMILVLNLILYMSVIEYSKDQTTPGDYIGFILALWLFLQPIKRIGMGYSSLVYAGVAAERVLNILENNNENEFNLDQGNPIKNIKSISFENICFNYDEKNILENVNMHFEPGNIYLISGENGAGKSTILNSLLGFKSPKSGTIKLNGKNFSSYNLISIRSRISFVPQEIFLFNNTIKENIILGNIFNEEKYNNAKKLSKLQEVLNTRDRTDNSYLSEKGQNFSGGEKQRLCIARALFKDFDVLLLDEANSNISQNKFKDIISSIEKNKKNKIVIIISHDPKNWEFCDIIYQIKESSVLKVNNEKNINFY
ncbi:MAG: ABC transporter ATP-binding protein [Desulfobacterales bacterium]|nr:ABC transporter ATP-binding protein [Desulfobacterales bacterium]